jgi:hypothetical protein
MAAVTMPDGTVVQLPDTPTPEELAQIGEIQSMHAARNVNAAPAAKPAPARIEPSSNLVKAGIGGRDAGGAVALGGLPQGLLALPAMIAGASGWVGNKLSSFTHSPEEKAKPGYVPEGKAERWIRENIFGPLSDAPSNLHNVGYTPKTEGEKWTKSVSEGVGGAVAPGGLLKNAVIGAMSGAGAEAGERIIGGPAGRILGGVAGGGLGAVPGVFAGNVPSLARRAMAGVNEEDVISALQNMQYAKDAGLKLTFGQALGKASNVDALESALANSEVGKNVQSILRAQPVQAANATRGQIRSLPGEILPETSAALLAQQGATSAISGAKKALSAKVGALTPTRGNMTQSEVNDMRGMVESMATQYPKGTSTGDALRELSAKLINKETGKPYQNIEQLDNILKDVASGVKNPALGAKAVDAHGQGLITNAITDIRAMIGSRYPNFAKSKALYAEGKDTVINPLKEGVIGQIAKRNGFQEGNATLGDVAKVVFSKGTNPDARSSDILTMQNELTKAGASEAFLTPAKTYLSNLLAKAVTLDSSGAAEGTAGAIKNAIQGDVMQKAGLRDILVGMARAQKQPDNAIYPGFERVMDVITRAAKRPQKVMGMNEHEIRGDTARNAMSNALRVFSFMPVEKVAGNVERVYSQQAMSALDRMVSSPSGVKELQRIAKLPAGSKEAEIAVATMLSTYAGADTEVDVK